MLNWTRPSPSIFAYHKQSKLDGGKAWNWGYITTSMKLLQTGGALALLCSWKFDFLQSTETQYRADSCKMGWEQCSRVQFWNCSQCSCSGQGTRTRTMRKAQWQAINNQKPKNKSQLHIISLFCFVIVTFHSSSSEWSAFIHELWHICMGVQLVQTTAEARITN